MPLLVVGMLLLIAKVTEFGPVANWSWWIVLAPFALTAAWWSFADSSGLTKRREVEKIEKRKAQRRAKAMEALGMDAKRHAQVTRVRQDAAARSGVSADPTQAHAAPDVRPREPRF